MKEQKQYLITFENGCNLFINASSVSDAIRDGLESLMSCFPPEVDRSRMVEATQVKRFGACCQVCGKYLKDSVSTLKIPAEGLSIGADLCISCARRVADAYEELYAAPEES